MLQEEILLQMVAQERQFMPRVGGRVLLELIKGKLPPHLVPGRDKFFDVLRAHKLLVKRRRLRATTTDSNHWLRKYPNLIKGFCPVAAHQLWVSDITYIRIGGDFAYLSLITDGYSRKIIGWALGDTLEAKHSVKALKMALRQLPKDKKGVYHHSDRGVQYCSEEYVKILKKKKFQISMTESGDPLDNAIAERINGILKDGWLNDIQFRTIDEARKKISEVIRIYNTRRPHSSINMLTPEKAHLMQGELKRLWKNYYKYTYGNLLINSEKDDGDPAKRW